MSILSPTTVSGRIVWLGLVRDRSAGLMSHPEQSVRLNLEGLIGESHSGLTRRSCSRMTRQHPLGTELRNTRQISIISAEELEDVRQAMGLPELDPSWLGANIVFQGVPQLTNVPPSTRFIFESGVSIVVDVENTACKYPAEVIESIHPGKGLSFGRHAAGRRGIVGWVERGGQIALGDQAILHVPPQRIYEPALTKQRLGA